MVPGRFGGGAAKLVALKSLDLISASGPSSGRRAQLTIVPLEA